MIKLSLRILIAFGIAMTSANLSADVIIGAKVPDFQGKDLQGKTRQLNDYTGKIVVLEWSSPECPYSRRYYENGTLDALYDFASKNEIVWINIVPALQKLPRETAFANIDTSKKIIILDSDLNISSAFGATTTPQIFILNRQGILAYSGAIDSSAMLKTTASKNIPYTRNALEDLLAGHKVRKPITRVLGCFVKSNTQSTNGLPTITGSGSR